MRLRIGIMAANYPLPAPILWVGRCLVLLFLGLALLLAVEIAYAVFGAFLT